MKRSLLKKIASIFTASALIFSALPGFAQKQEEEPLEVVFEDVTGKVETLFGEAKVKVSVKGAQGKVFIAETHINFEGLEYKGIEFLQGLKNNPPECVLLMPNAALANADGEIAPCIISDGTSDLSISEEKTELFILTFAGEPGESVTLTLDQEETYYMLDGLEDDNEFSAKRADDGFESAQASDVEKASKNASVLLTMDKVTSFKGGDGKYSDSGVELKITSETTGYTIYTVLNNVLESKGGHRLDGMIPAFKVENTVLSNDTYTVELSGPGYKSYYKAGVTFDEELQLTNADFIPGDIDGDGYITATDKELCQEVIDLSGYDIVCDLNRDTFVNKLDLDLIVVPEKEEEDKEEEDEEDDDDNSGSGGGGGGGGSSGGSSGGGAGIVLPSTPTVSNEAFSDLGNYQWAKESIYALKNKGIINGTSDTEFSPQNNIKRGDFILILTRMLNLNNEFSDNFSDVPSTSYYYEAIGKAKAAGIAQGSGVSFNPENSISRQDLITLSYRAFLNLGYIAENTDMTALDAFSDKADISDYAVNAMASMVNAGIIKGSNGGVNPKGNATRAEVAVMCERLLGLIK